MAKKKSKTALAVRGKAAPPARVSDSSVTMFERLAKDKSVPVEKLEKLIELQERIMKMNAVMAFNTAFAVMQGKIPIIGRSGTVDYTTDRGRTNFNFSTHADIIRAVRPVLEEHGFTIRHRNVFVDGKIKIIGILSHRDGHSEQDEFEAAADSSGGKNPIQALGSTREYGRRYTTKSLLGIVDEETRAMEAAAEILPAPERPRRAPQTQEPIDAQVQHGEAEVISEKQRKRLFAIAKKAGRANDLIKSWLAVAYNIDSTTKIRRRDYDAIIKAIETAGPLPITTRLREPGEEG